MAKLILYVIFIVSPACCLWSQTQKLQKLEVEELLIKSPNGKGYIKIGFSEQSEPSIAIYDKDSVLRYYLYCNDTVTFSALNAPNHNYTIMHASDDWVGVFVSDELRESIDLGIRVYPDSTQTKATPYFKMEAADSSDSFTYSSRLIGGTYRETFYMNNLPDYPIAGREFNPFFQQLVMGGLNPA